MACEGFHGVMSCACHEQCIEAFGFDSVGQKLCFEVLSGDGNESVAVKTISDLPSEAARVRFWMWDRVRGSAAKGYSKWPVSAVDAALSASSSPPPYKKARQIYQHTSVILPNNHCPQSCGGSGQCMTTASTEFLQCLSRLRTRNAAKNGGSLGGRRGMLERPFAVRARSMFSMASRRRGLAPTPGGDEVVGPSSHCTGAKPRCVCHVGSAGDGCQDVDLSVCLHGCSGHGRCVSRMCLCERGRWGFDCSISSVVEPRSTLPHRAPIYVYPPHGDINLLWGTASLPGRRVYSHGLYQGLGMKGDGWSARGVFAANVVFLERAHSRGHLVAEPEGAALFVVPILISQVFGNLVETQPYLEAVIRTVRTTFPFWNRSAGADHIFFTTQDMGGCFISPSMHNSIIVSQFGFVASAPFWMSKRRWSTALDGEPLERLLELRRHRNGWHEICRGPLHEQLLSGCVDRMQDGLARSWMGSHRWHGACYNSTKDVVMPTDFEFSRSERAITRRAARVARAASHCQTEERAQDISGPRFGSEKPANSMNGDATSDNTTLIFMSGSVSNTAPWYSQGVRQAFLQWHSKTPGVVFKEGHWTLSDLRGSTFCLCPSGWGFGWRIYLALATLCVPVIVQPLVEQAFHDLLPYEKFSLSFPLSDVRNLPELLRAIPREKVCQLRAAAAKYYRALVWQTPDGRAYEMLHLALCRRAAEVRLRLRPHEKPPKWTRCMQVTAEDILRLEPQEQHD